MRLKQIGRTLSKNKFYSLLNIGGLSLAAVCGVFIYQFIAFEQSYDTFHEDSSSIYRVATYYGDHSDPSNGDAMNSAPFGPTVTEELASVTDFVRLSPFYNRMVFQYERNNFEEEKVYYTDNSFFDVFGHTLAAGDRNSALLKPQTVVLSMESAEKYFGQRENWVESPIGKTIRINNQADVEVTGILEKIPLNTHLKFDALISFPTFKVWQGDPMSNWHWNDFYNYIKTQPGTQRDILQKQLDDFAERTHGENAPGLQQLNYLLQPVEDIHLFSKLPYETEPGGSRAALKILFLIGLFIVLIAWSNYVNLATAKARDRVQEVGLRKVLGASRGALFAQFLGETFLLNVVAGTLALCAIRLLQPLVNDLAGAELSALPGMSLTVFYLLLGSVILGTIIAGVYPAYSLLRIDARQSVDRESKKVEWLRKGLVVFQYSASMVLLISTLVIFKQLNYMQSVDLGFAADQKLVLKAPTEIIDSIEKALFATFRSEAIQYPTVREVASSSAIPGQYYLDLNVWGGVGREGVDEGDYQAFVNYQIDDQYMEVYGLEVIAGEAFSKDKESDDGNIAISESAVSKFGFATPRDAIGQRIRFGSDNNIPTVTSVFKDYHHKSPRHAMEPLILWNENGNILYYTVQLQGSSTAQIEQTVADLQNIWNRVAPNTPFQYFFFDDQFNQQYEADQRLAKIVSILSVFAIFIACLGLFGLTSYMVAVRRKEIGIRKVLGASIQNVMRILSINYLKLVLIACALGIPLAIYLTNSWLEGFEYRTHVGMGTVVIATLITVVVAATTVSSLTMRAAMANPVDVINEDG